MDEFKTNEIFAEVNERLKVALEREKGYLEKAKEKLEKPTKKLDLSTKIDLNLKIKNYREKISNIEKIKSSFFQLHYEDSKGYTLPDSMKERLDGLGSALSKEETQKLNQIINDSLKNVNSDKKKKVEQSVKMTEKILKESKMGEFSVYVNSKEISLDRFVSIIEQRKMIELTSKYIYIEKDKEKIEMSTSDQMLVSSLENMIENKQLDESKNAKNVINNFDAIKESFSNKAKLDVALTKLFIVQAELNKVEEVDFSKVKAYLKQLESNYQKEMVKTDKFLSQFNFDAIRKEIEEKREQEEIEKFKNDKISNYRQLAYQLEKVMTETPDAYDKIQELQEAMRDAATRINMRPDQIEDIAIEGKTKYREETKKEQAKRAAVKEQQSYEKQLKSEVMSEIREFAERELESAGYFEEQHEYRNGDVHSKPIDKEAMIQNKIKELLRIVDMTPEERGLEDQIKHGYLKADTRLEDLTPSQINDFRIGYSDAHYQFIPDYKRWRERENLKPIVNNIFKEYLNYRASLENKKEYLNFKDYAKQKHNIENADVNLVDKGLKDELEEIMDVEGRTR